MRFNLKVRQRRRIEHFHRSAMQVPTVSNYVEASQQTTRPALFCHGIVQHATRRDVHVPLRQGHHTPILFD
jgi:hypothetical protein